jgi:hypothetical protein
LSCEELSALVHRLLPFLHNSSSVVRLSSLKTLAASIKTSENNPGTLFAYNVHQSNKNIYQASINPKF